MIWILLQKYFSPNLQQHMSKKTQFSSCQKSSFIISARAMTKLCREKWVSAVEKMTNYKVSHLLTFWQANANWNVKTSVNYLASLRSDEVFFWNSWICLNWSYLIFCNTNNFEFTSSSNHIILRVTNLEISRDN